MICKHEKHGWVDQDFNEIETAICSFCDEDMKTHMEELRSEKNRLIVENYELKRRLGE